LLDHADTHVRFQAFGALSPALDRQEPGTRALLNKLLNDPNEGVRQRAEAAAARLLVRDFLP